MRRWLTGLLSIVALAGFGGVANATLTDPGIPQWHFITHDEYGYVGQARLLVNPWQASSTPTAPGLPVGITWSASMGAPAGCTIEYDTIFREPPTYDPGGDYEDQRPGTTYNFNMQVGGGGPWYYTVWGAFTGSDPVCPNPPDTSVGSDFTSSATLFVDQQTKGTFSSGWTVKTLSSAFGGSLKRSVKSGSYVTYSCSSCKNIAVIGTVGPSYGSSKLYVDGKATKTFSAYSTTQTTQAIFAKIGWASDGKHMIKLVNLGTSGHPTIDLDGFAYMS